jgi:DNA invertase Pin-like site-specific DNA recombinase
MLKDATRGKFDVAMAWSMDRMGRSLADLVGSLQELRGSGCDLFLHQRAIDTTTPAGKAMFQMLGVLSEFERSMIEARVKAGLARAREAGKTLGRAKVPAEAEEAIRAHLAAGTGILKTAKLAGVGVSVVYRVKAESTLTDMRCKATAANEEVAA